jgi:cbb3-type cytochrome c oxidase subunit II
VSFGGGLHTNHRAIVAAASIVFFVLTLVMAILPALREQAFSASAVATPRDSQAERGRHVFMREGCGFCHTQFVRDLPMDRPYGRPSRPGDYVGENPPMLGTQRTGPDLADVGTRQPSEAWHLIHLYDPRAVVPQSVMPAYRWYFVAKDQAGPGDVVVPVPAGSAPSGKVIVAGPEATALARYLLSLKQPKVSP